MHRMGAWIVLCRKKKKKVNTFCAYLQGWLKYKMDFLKHLKKLKNSIYFFKITYASWGRLSMPSHWSAPPWIKAPPRQLRLLLVEAGYDPDPTTYEGNKWLERTSWFAQEPRENSGLMSSDRLQVSRLETGQRWLLQGASASWAQSGWLAQGERLSTTKLMVSNSLGVCLLAASSFDVLGVCFL